MNSLPSQILNVSGYFMRHYILIISFSICSLTVSAQTSSIDSLVNKINNNQLIGVCHYFWMLEMKSSAGDSLIAIGKPATQRLLSLLTDTGKGIIVHYILSNIWFDSVTSWSSFARFDKEKIVDYEYCKLKFFSKDIQNKEQMTAIQKDLEDNKKRWLKLTTKNSR